MSVDIGFNLYVSLGLEVKLNEKVIVLKRYNALQKKKKTLA